jgi:hypothetical protein
MPTRSTTQHNPITPTATSFCPTSFWTARSCPARQSSGGHPSRRPHDDGQSATLAVIALTTLAVVIIMAIAQLGTVVLERSAAQTAADAAALAAVAGGRSAAEAVAHANGAAVVQLRAGLHEVIVTVRIGDAVATARATDAP